MTTSKATLLHGEPQDVLTELETWPFDLEDLTLALANAFTRLHNLERQLAALRATSHATPTAAPSTTTARPAQPG